MDYIASIGTNVYFWIWFASALVSVFFIWLFVKQAITLGKELAKGDFNYDAKKRGIVRRLVFSGILAIAVVCFFFVAYGAGKPTEMDSADSSGIFSVVNSGKKEMTPEEIKRDQERRKKDTLEPMSPMDYEDDANRYYNGLDKKYPKK